MSRAQPVFFTSVSLFVDPGPFMGEMLSLYTHLLVAQVGDMMVQHVFVPLHEVNQAVNILVTSLPIHCYSQLWVFAIFDMFCPKTTTHIKIILALIAYFFQNFLFLMISHLLHHTCGTLHRCWI